MSRLRAAAQVYRAIQPRSIPSPHASFTRIHTALTVQLQKRFDFQWQAISLVCHFAFVNSRNPCQIQPRVTGYIMNHLSQPISQRKEVVYAKQTATRDIPKGRGNTKEH